MNIWCKFCKQIHWKVKDDSCLCFCHEDYTLGCKLKCKPCKGQGRGGHKGCEWICPDCNGTGAQIIKS